jgi:hypothetical protein
LNSLKPVREGLGQCHRRNALRVVVDIPPHPRDVVPVSFAGRGKSRIGVRPKLVSYLGLQVKSRHGVVEIKRNQVVTGQIGSALSPVGNVRGHPTVRVRVSDAVDKASSRRPRNNDTTLVVEGIKQHGSSRASGSPEMPHPVL